jgi:hypothetical protein
MAACDLQISSKLYHYLGFCMIDARAREMLE